MGDSKKLSAHRRKGAIEGGCWLVFAILAYVYTFQFDAPQIGFQLGPAFWPRLIIIGIVIAAGWTIYSNLVGITEGKEGESTKVTTQASKKVDIRVALIFASPVVYVILMHQFGFLLVTPFFLFFYMRLLGVQKWRTLFIITAFVYATIILVFVRLIFTYMPPGRGIFHTMNGYIVGFFS